MSVPEPADPDQSSVTDAGVSAGAAKRLEQGLRSSSSRWAIDPDMAALVDHMTGSQPTVPVAALRLAELRERAATIREPLNRGGPHLR